VAGIAYASIPDANGVIHSCYNSDNGALRVFGKSKDYQQCNAGEKALDWSQTGPTGPTGLTGARGPVGPTEGVGATPVAPAVTPPALTSELSASDTSALRSTFTTTVSGKLYLSKSVTALTDCASASSVFWWIILDGTAVPSSVTFAIDDNWVSTTAIGVTDSVVAAGTHVMTLGETCLNPDPANTITMIPYSGGTAVVLG
jgi:hypothetical protein